MVIVYGFHPVREALRQRPDEVLRVLIGADRRGKRVEEISSLCRTRGIQCVRVPEKQLGEISDGVHNGFVVETEAAPKPESSGDENLIVLVEDVQDPRNLGALLRVCEGAGVSRVLVRDRGSSPITAAVTKTAAGATEWLPIERVTNSSNSMQEYQKRGFWAYGADMSGRPPWELDLSGKLMLCFGGEQKGLRRRTRESCDNLIGLPMRGHVDSLNVATAVAAILFEAVRQRS